MSRNNETAASRWAQEWAETKPAGMPDLPDPSLCYGKGWDPILYSRWQVVSVAYDAWRAGIEAGKREAAELIETIQAWNEEGLGTCPEIGYTNYPDAWADVSKRATA